MRFHPEDAEDELVQWARNGSTEAWNQLVEMYSATVYRYIRRRWPPRFALHHSPEDILQETLLQAWMQIINLRGSTLRVFVAWLKSVADLRMLDAMKMQQRLKRGGGRHRVARGPMADDDNWNALLDQLPSEAQTASSVLKGKERIMALRTAIGALPSEQQMALELHYLEGGTLEETARRMKRTRAAVRGLLHRGKEKLAENIRLASSWLSSRN